MAQFQSIQFFAPAAKTMRKIKKFHVVLHKKTSIQTKLCTHLKKYCVKLLKMIIGRCGRRNSLNQMRNFGSLFIDRNRQLSYFRMLTLSKEKTPGDFDFIISLVTFLCE